MIKSIIYSSIAIVSGIFLLSFPAFLGYLNQNTLFFDIGKFLNDYPAFRFVFGIALVVAGSGEIVYLFLLAKYKTVFVIQESSDGDYGNPDLHYSFFAKGDNEEIVYTNLASLNNHPQAVIELEKKRIRLFYEKLPKQKKIAFLAVATIPSVVYAGYVVGENGRKLKYYHWIREKNKAKRIIGFRRKCILNVAERINASKKNVNDFVVYVSTSYLPYKEQAIKQFGDVNYIFCQSNLIGVDVVKTKKELLGISKKVREVISDIKVSGATVHLILQCSSEICFAIGQKLNSSALPNIKIYSFNNRNLSENWDWFICLN